MQDFLSIDRKKSREDTFGKTGSLSMSSVASGSGGVSLQEPIPVRQLGHQEEISADTYVVFFIHCCCCVVVVVVGGRWRDRPIDVSRGE